MTGYTRRETLMMLNATEAQLASMQKFYGKHALRPPVKMGEATRYLSVCDYVAGVASFFEKRGTRIGQRAILETCLNVLEDDHLVEFIYDWNQRRAGRGTMGDTPSRLRDTPEKVLVAEYLLMNFEIWGDRAS